MCFSSVLYFVLAARNDKNIQIVREDHVSSVKNTASYVLRFMGGRTVRVFR